MKLWAFGKVSLKLSELEFWSLTWAEFQGLSEALADEDEKQNRRFGRVMALLANINRGKGQPAKSEEDFIPKRQKNEMATSKEDIKDQINSVFDMFR